LLLLLFIMLFFVLLLLLLLLLLYDLVIVQVAQCSRPSRPAPGPFTLSCTCCPTSWPGAKCP
jgi:hypothetical protein